MIPSLFGGSAVIATALVTASTLFYASPLVAEAALASHTTIHQQQQEPTSAQELKKPAPAPPAPLPETSLDSSEVVAAPMPALEAPVAVPAPVDVLPAAPPAPKPAAEIKDAPAAAPQAYLATAYSLLGRTASGRPVGKGIIAADPRVLPLGTRVHLDAGPYSGEYVVADSGGAVKGRKIDVWVPSNREAFRFGRRNIKLTVLSYGAKKKAGGRK